MASTDATSGVSNGADSEDEMEGVRRTMEDGLGLRVKRGSINRVVKIGDNIWLLMVSAHSDGEIVSSGPTG